MLTAEDENVMLRQYIARLFNTFASITEGLVLITITVFTISNGFIII